MPVRGKKTVDSRGGSSWQRLLYSPLSRAKQRFQETVVQGRYSFSSLRSSSRVTPLREWRLLWRLGCGLLGTNIA